MHPGGGEKANALRKKIAERLRVGDRVAIAEICDYEARRELLRKGAIRQLQNLDELVHRSEYFPIDTDLMKAAAALWADMRRKGVPTSAESGLDGDVILAAQARRFDDHVVLTANSKHLSELCNTLEMDKLI